VQTPLGTAVSHLPASQLCSRVRATQDYASMVQCQADQPLILDNITIGRR